jgi:hypothetical protein
MDTADRILEDILAVMGGSVRPEEQQVIDYLTYCCYKANRERGMTADDLLKLFPQTGAAMEQRLESEANAYADKTIWRDKEARHTGEERHDLDIVGRALMAGH